MMIELKMEIDEFGWLAFNVVTALYNMCAWMGPVVVDGQAAEVVCNLCNVSPKHIDQF